MARERERESPARKKTGGKKKKKQMAKEVYVRAQLGSRVPSSTRVLNLAAEAKIVNQVGEAEKCEERGKVKLPVPLHRKTVRPVHRHLRH